MVGQRRQAKGNDQWVGYSQRMPFVNWNVSASASSLLLENTNQVYLYRLCTSPPRPTVHLATSSPDNYVGESYTLLLCGNWVKALGLLFKSDKCNNVERKLLTYFICELSTIVALHNRAMHSCSHTPHSFNDRWSISTSSVITLIRYWSSEHMTVSGLYKYMRVIDPTPPRPTLPGFRMLIFSHARLETVRNR
jgi:hypothetical protein